MREDPIHVKDVQTVALILPEDGRFDGSALLDDTRQIGGVLPQHERQVRRVLPQNGRQRPQSRGQGWNMISIEGAYARRFLRRFSQSSLPSSLSFTDRRPQISHINGPVLAFQTTRGLHLFEVRDNPAFRQLVTKMQTAFERSHTVGYRPRHALEGGSFSAALMAQARGERTFPRQIQFGDAARESDAESDSSSGSTTETDIILRQTERQRGRTESNSDMIDVD